MNISGMISGFIVALFGLVLFPVYTGFTDDLNSSLQAHCTSSAAEEFRQVTSSNPQTAVTKPTAYSLSKSATAGPTIGGAATLACDISRTAAAGTVYTPDGTGITLGGADTTLPTATYYWVDQPPVLSRFSAINTLVTSVMPLLLAVGFLSVGFLTGARGMSGGGISSAMGKEVVILITAVVGIALMPVLVDFLTTAGAAVDGRYQVTVRFGLITDLALSIIPTLATLGIAALTLKTTQKGYQTYKGRGEDSMM